MNPSLPSLLACWLDQGRRVAAASIVEVSGSTPHGEGLVMLVNDHGDIAGAISGGCLDGAVAVACEKTLHEKQPGSEIFGASEGVWGAPGLTCGGSVRVWTYELPPDIGRRLAAAEGGQLTFTLEGSLETGPAAIRLEDSPSGDERTILSIGPQGRASFREQIGHRDLILLVGRSGFTEALIRCGRLLGCEVMVNEPRPRFAESLVGPETVVRSWPDACLRDLVAAGRLTERSAVIVCTHDPKFDEPALLAAVRSPAGFIGAMGSRRTVEDRRMRLAGLGLSPTELDRIRSPLGLDLGGTTPAETAISVFAEWIAFRHGGSARPLTEGRGSIHGAIPPRK